MRKVKSFHRFAKTTARVTGRPTAFVIAVTVILLWGTTGPLFHYSDTWQLVINTATTIITFLMVFLIQNTQNRDSEAIHIKLDEIVRASRGAHNALLDLEELEDEELARIRVGYQELARRSRQQIENGGNDGDSPEVNTPPQRLAALPDTPRTQASAPAHVARGLVWPLL